VKTLLKLFQNIYTKKQKNNICIIGLTKRNSTDISLIETAKTLFDSVLFIPITSIHLEIIGKKIIPMYRNSELTGFNTVLVRVPQKYYSLAAIIIDTIPSTFKAQTTNTFKYASNKVLMFKRLDRLGINIPKISFITDVKSFQYSLEKIKFPIIIQNPVEKNKKAIANNKREAKDIIETFQTFNQMLMLEEKEKKGKKASVYISGNKIVSCLCKNKEVDITKDMEQSALDACKALETNYARVDLIGNKVIDVDVSPSLKNIKKNRKQISDEMLENIEHISKIRRSGIATKVIDDILSAFD